MSVIFWSVWLYWHGDVYAARCCELVTPMAPEIKKRIVRFLVSDGALAFSGGRLYVPLWRCD